MIANLFFSLIAAGFAAEAAAKARYERLWSFLLLGILALLGFNFWENGRLGIVETFAFHWIDTSLMRVDVNLNTDAAVYGLAAPFVLLTGISVFYNTFYKAEADKLRLNGLLLLNLAAVILVICAQNFMQLLTAVCIADVLCLFMINDIEGKRRYVFYNLLADMGLFTLFALIWKQTGSISLSALSGYHQPGQYPELTVGLLLFCAFIKSGMFLFQGGFLNLAGLSFNRIFSVSYCATPLIGILLLIKAYPLLGNVAYAPVALELFGGLTLLWAFVGAISIDNLKDKALYFVGNKLLKYVYKNPQKNMLKLVKLGKAVAGKMYPESTFTKPIEIISDETNVWHKYLFNGLNDIDPDFFRSAVLTFAIDLGLNGTKTLRKKREEEHCNIPWVILMDPTSACNLRCKGCWAAEYGHNSNLTLDEMHSVLIFICLRAANLLFVKRMF